VQSIRPLLMLAVMAVPIRGAVAQAHEEMPMEMQPGADQMKVSVRSPTEGSKVTSNNVTLETVTTGFTKRCDLAGTPNQAGTGHYHVLVDKSLVNMFCSDDPVVSLAGLQPGPHILTVVPAQNDHAEIEKNAASVKIDYQPRQTAQASVKGTAPAGAPSIKITSPKPGAAVWGSFSVRVEVRGFTLTCDEMGRPDVPGHGHWHLNFDTMKGPMMGMMTMAGMSCEKSLLASTAGLKPGSTHQLIALLADNGHAPLMPVLADSVAVVVK